MRGPEERQCKLYEIKINYMLLSIYNLYTCVRAGSQLFMVSERQTDCKLTSRFLNKMWVYELRSPIIFIMTELQNDKKDQ